ncbi:iron uptake porin [Limnofasciculus baicalensis]|uniref:Iron uptake porin n=1 Tax=Limnofasciculus baicalensis BBK-W-15 TaxID=2699891 RepID=A0AAE3GUP5_9CYAN|nr:iron uptake porin [Limnofasciculus baicalensis]MCP2730804.1 iron uptake porin [Limnofasciculus baicalensis BBK-W-15]
MSKLMWKSLIISPAVLIATLAVSALGVRAATNADLPLAENKAETVVQPLTAEAQAPKEESVKSAVAPTAPESQAAPLFAADAVKVPIDIAQAAPSAGNDDQILDQINRYSNEGTSNSQGQVTNIGQLRDVSPGDWAYEALRNLVERYGCIAGYPDGTYRGNRALSRYEFAAGLNACLNQIERIIDTGSGPVDDGSIASLRRLVQEFQAELQTLTGRVDNLEGRVSFLEDHQFSTTTKLDGEVIFALTDEFGLDNVENNTVFQDRVRLTLNTSFTGQDRLVTRLAAGNATKFNGVGYEGTQTFNIGDTGSNNVVVDWLAYYFPFKSSKVYVAATGGIHSDYAPTLNPYFEDYDGGNGALSTFASENPIYRIGGGAGAAVSLGVGPLKSVLGPSTLTIGYLAGPDAANPANKNGLFNGDYSALAQLNFNLADRIGIGVTYVHAYNNTGTDIFDLGGGAGKGVVGTTYANNPGSIAGVGGVPVVTNSYGVEAAFRLSKNISISGFGTYTDAILIGKGDAEIWTYGAGLAFSDLGKEGNILGIFAGAQPYAGSVDSPGVNQRVKDVPFHVEAFYKYQLTDNISITPGVIWLINPNGDQATNQDDAFIGTLRTTFKF